MNLDDDVCELIRSCAESRATALGRAASELVRRGYATHWPTRRVNGLVVLDAPADSPCVTSGQVKRLEAEDV